MRSVVNSTQLSGAMYNCGRRLGGGHRRFHRRFATIDPTSKSFNSSSSSHRLTVQSVFLNDRCYVHGHPVTDEKCYFLQMG